MLIQLNYTTTTFISKTLFKSNGDQENQSCKVLHRDYVFTSGSGLAQLVKASS